MTLTPSAYALLGLTALVAALVAVLVFAMLRLAAAARQAQSGVRGTGTETAFLSAALQEAVTKLKAQERATAARADASERLNGEINRRCGCGSLARIRSWARSDSSSKRRGRPTCLPIRARSCGR